MSEDAELELACRLAAGQFIADLRAERAARPRRSAPRPPEAQTRKPVPATARRHQITGAYRRAYRPHGSNFSSLHALTAA
jgi:hypothetical protein